MIECSVIVDCFQWCGNIAFVSVTRALAPEMGECMQQCEQLSSLFPSEVQRYLDPVYIVCRSFFACSKVKLNFYATITLCYLLSTHYSLGRQMFQI